MGRDEASFDHLPKGNGLYREGMRYKEAESLGLFARLPDLLDTDTLAAARGSAGSSVHADSKHRSAASTSPRAIQASPSARHCSAVFG
ncbi:hypothetical protein OKW43_004414 [Paraburkholderia sp. WC7.3g]|uniref:hypothetical protein n=1 Tax=Paraburkholderia sp. WC7.3g TaxID=2991070 RepID=UPI003D2538E0